jgi:hypothetical protein
MDAGERRQIAVVRLLTESYGLLGKPSDAADAFADASDASPTDALLAYEGALAAQRAHRVATAKRLADRAALLGHQDAAALVKSLTE